LVVAFEPSGNAAPLLFRLRRAKLMGRLSGLLVFRSSARVVFQLSKAQPHLRHVKQNSLSFLIICDAQKFHAFVRVAPIVLRATLLENPVPSSGTTRAVRYLAPGAASAMATQGLVSLFRRILLKNFNQEECVGTIQPTQAAYGSTNNISSKRPHRSSLG
jgi:hypothetical protein